MATLDCRTASRWTQCTVGLLSLNRATCASVREGHTPSMTNQSSKSPAISQSELDIFPCGLSSVTTPAVIAGRHWTQKTIGRTLMFSPIIMPPAPCALASVMPTKSGHPNTKFRHFVGDSTDSWRSVRQSATSSQDESRFLTNYVRTIVYSN